MTSKPTVTPALWIKDNFDEAVNFYTTTFKDAVCTFHIPGIAAEITIHGRPLSLIAGDNTHSINPSISGLLHFSSDLFGSTEEAREYLEELYPKLSAGGVLMPLDEYPFSPRFAWVQDPFGFTWQLMLEEGGVREEKEENAAPRPFLVPAFMFGGSNHGNCEQATNEWISLLGGQRTSINHYGPESELEEGAVMLTYFQLAGNTYAAMDSGAYHQFTFNPGVSLVLSCTGQEELDRYWETLSTQPEHERCGWCVDKWGVSWQVIPNNLGEIMSIPGNQEILMRMGKIIIEDFQQAQ